MEPGNEFKILENSKRKLGYDVEFRNLLRQHPRIVGTVRDIFEKLKSTSEGDSIRIDGVTATNVRYNPADDTTSLCAKIEFDSHQFLVKEELKMPGIAGGFWEYQSSHEAARRLKDVPDVEVIDAKLGYSAKKNSDGDDTSFFVSRWENLPRLKEYLLTCSREDATRLDLLFQRIQRVLHDFSDVETNNIFYNQETHKLIVYDLMLNPFRQSSDEDD